MQHKNEGEDLKSIDKVFFIICLILTGGLAVLAILQSTGMVLLTDLGFPCSFRLVSGYYCPGCGGTHAVCALAAGDLITCAKEHAFVLYATFGIFIFLLWNTFSTIYNKKTGSAKIPVMHFYTAYIYVGIAIIFIQWIIKNALLIIHSA